MCGCMFRRWAARAAWNAGVERVRVRAGLRRSEGGKRRGFQAWVREGRRYGRLREVGTRAAGRCQLRVMADALVTWAELAGKARCVQAMASRRNRQRQRWNVVSAWGLWMDGLWETERDRFVRGKVCVFACVFVAEWVAGCLLWCALVIEIVASIHLSALLHISIHPSICACIDTYIHTSCVSVSM